MTQLPCAFLIRHLLQLEKLKIQSLSWAFGSLVKHDPWFSSTLFPGVCPKVSSCDLEPNLAWFSGAPHSNTPEACLPVLTDASPDCASEGPGRPEASSFPLLRGIRRPPAQAGTSKDTACFPVRPFRTGSRRCRTVPKRNPLHHALSSLVDSHSRLQ